jgi:phage portal protein BeeE
VIRFDGDGTGGWLTTGVDAINTAAALEASVLRSAEMPSPAVILKNTGADLSSTQVDALLDAWETARSNRSTAYLNSALETESLTGWSPNELQLTEARNAAAAMVARVANLDPIWCGAGVPGSSLTYGNRVDLRKDLVDLALRPVMAMISERLTATDVTPRGHEVEFDTDVFLRANTTDLATVIAQMHPLGVISTDEARVLLDIGEVE